MTDTAPGPALGDSDEATLRTARIIALALVLGPLVMFIVALLVRTDPLLPAAGLPAGLLGLIGPVAGYRVYQALRGRIPPDRGARERRHAFQAATLLALGITEGIALLSIVAFWLSGKPIALVGLATHAILAGAVWPSEQRLQGFLGGPR